MITISVKGIGDLKTEERPFCFVGEDYLRKETYEKFDKAIVFCKACGKYIPKSCTSYSNLKSDGTTKECHFCGWVKRNGGIPIIDGYSQNEVADVAKYILYSDGITINEISNSMNYSIEKTIDIVTKLHIANKSITIQCECNNCGNSFAMRLTEYKQNKNHFCSKPCYYEYKKKNAKYGSDNKQYNRIKTHCSNCGKDIEIIPYDFNKKNSFGDSNHFCCQKCYWDFRSNYYRGEKAHRYHVPWTDEQYERIRKNLIANMTKSDRLNTSIQLKINEILDLMEIKYEREKIFDYYSIDNYLNDYDLAIEVMGDYWHSNPYIYNSEKRLINKQQYKGIIKDKAKNTFLTNKNIPILYLWESDINANVDLCMELIKLFVMNEGQIKDNNSFNWILNDKQLIIKDTIAKPYFMVDNDVYRKLLKEQNKMESVTTTGGARQRAS